MLRSLALRVLAEERDAAVSWKNAVRERERDTQVLWKNVGGLGERGEEGDARVRSARG